MSWLRWCVLNQMRQDIISICAIYWLWHIHVLLKVNLKFIISWNHIVFVLLYSDIKIFLIRIFNNIKVLYYNTFICTLLPLVVSFCKTFRYCYALIKKILIFILWYYSISSIVILCFLLLNNVIYLGVQWNICIYIVERLNRVNKHIHQSKYYY
jgi:hypothetical protein